MGDPVLPSESEHESLNRELILPAGEAQDDEHDKYLTFELKDTSYAVDISGIKEIIEYGQVTKIPMAPAYIRGVINLRGNVVPIVDLSVRLGKDRLEWSKKTCVIILEIEQSSETMVLGFVVDSVNEVVDIVDDSVEAAPSFGMDIRTDFVSGMGRVNDSFVTILDLDKVLSIKELSRFFDNSAEVQGS